MMFLIYRLAIIAAACAVAAIAGLSVAFLATPRTSPRTPTAAAFAAPTAVPTAVPTISTAAPQPVPTVPPATSAATASLSAAPAPTAIPVRSAAEILQQVKASISKLHTGQIDAVIDYGNGNLSSASVVFALGDRLLPSKFDITTTYVGTSGRQTTQRITINDRTWQRQADAAWIAQPAQESAAGELRTFLPNFDSITKLDVRDEAGLLALHWLGANGDDITLLIDPDTNLPHQLRQQARATGTLFTVTYQSWNAPVEINPPR
jgi:hypothetical protein